MMGSLAYTVVNCGPEAVLALLDGEVRSTDSGNMHRTCFHEAGHTVVARNFWGVGPISYVEQTNDGRGIAMIIDPADATDRERIIVSLAGPVADFEWQRRNGLGLCRSLQNSGDDKDLPIITGMLKRPVDWGEWEDCRAETERMVRRYWDDITALAEALMVRGRLSGRQVGEIIGTASLRDVARRR